MRIPADEPPPPPPPTEEELELEREMEYFVEPEEGVLPRGAGAANLASRENAGAGARQ